MIMESAPPPSCVVIAFDATRDRAENELKLTVDQVRKNGRILNEDGRLLVLGILHRVTHPMGYQTMASPEYFGAASSRVMEEEVQKKVKEYATMLLPSCEEHENIGVRIEVKITAGFPIKQIIFQEVMTSCADWLVLDRHLQRELRHLNKIPCKVALVKDDLSVDVWRQRHTQEMDGTAQKSVYSLSKVVSVSDYHTIEEIEQSIISCESYPTSMNSFDSSDTLRSRHPYINRSRDHSSSSDFGSLSRQEKSGMNVNVQGIIVKGESQRSTNSRIVQRQNRYGFLPKSSNAPLLCTHCGTRTELYANDSMSLGLSDIQLATKDFSKDNLLGEGGYGYVYKGVLRDGQQIAAKVRKEESKQGFSEFHSEVYVLSFARHKNIVMLLGYCCKERQNILVYEYICNKSLYWHLYENATVLQWHQRYAIAIGTAKGLRFLHEECRGGPIIHRDMRPSNILLTHDFVPMLGDFGLAKWKTDGDDTLHTRILGTLGYLAPEYAEEGTVSVRTDVYAYGIVLLQLISGRKVVNHKNPEQESIRQWAEPLIEKLALQELIDPRLGDSFDTYELYLMAKAAYFCVQRNPAMRPSIREVVRFLEGENDHFHSMGDKFVPSYNK